jgi:hypothetical protein
MCQKHTILPFNEDDDDDIDGGNHRRVASGVGPDLLRSSVRSLRLQYYIEDHWYGEEC